MNKILITGAEGFIGSHLVEIALKKNYKVKASVMYNFNGSLGWAEHLNRHKNLEIVFGDIGASDSAEMLVRGCNYIINLAALISIPYSYETPHSYLYNNVLGTLNLLTSAKKNKIKHFIQASTSEVYGTAQYVPIDENHPLNPQSPYAASKVASDQFALSFYKSFDLPVNIIRPFNTFGPRQSLRAVIPTIIYQMIKNKGNINLGSLYPRRDFTYVTDTAGGILKMLNLKKFGNVINLGMGVDYSIKEILEIIAKKMKLKYKIKKIKDKIRPKKSEVNILNSNNTKAKKILQWKPKYFGKVGFERAIQKTIDWYLVEENLKKFNYKSNVK